MMRLGLAVAFDRERLGEEIEDHPLGLVGSRSVGEAAQDGDRLALAGLERLVGFERRESRPTSTTGDAASRWPSSPSSLGVIAIWCGPRRPRMVTVRIAECVERVERMADDVRAFELVRGSWTGCARNRARHCRCRSTAAWRAAERRIEVGEIGMAVVPADELGRADDAGQVLAGNAELAVVRRAGGEDHRVVEVEQLGDRDVAADA